MKQTVDGGRLAATRFNKSADDVLNELHTELSVRQKVALATLPLSALREICETRGPVALQIFVAMYLWIIDLCRRWGVAVPAPASVIWVFHNAPLDVAGTGASCQIPFHLLDLIRSVLRPGIAQLPKGAKAKFTLDLYASREFREVVGSLVERLGLEEFSAPALPRLLRRSRFQTRLEANRRHAAALKVRIIRCPRAVRACPRARRHTASRSSDRTASGDGDGAGGDCPAAPPRPSAIVRPTSPVRRSPNSPVQLMRSLNGFMACSTRAALATASPAAPSLRGRT